MSIEAISSLTRKIKETKDQIELIKNTCDSTSIINKFMLSEMERRLDVLNCEKEKLLNAQAKETVSIRIYGETVERGKISNRTLLSVLDGFQSMIDSIASVIDGSTSNKGKLSNRAKMLTDFKVTGTFAGSFGIKLEKNFEQLEMVSNSSDTSRIVNNFFDIIESGENPEILINNIIPFGKRTVIHYKEWLNQLKDQSINLEINWINDNADLRKLDLKYSETEKILFTLDSIEDSCSEEVILKGVLTGINVRKYTFELKTTTGIVKGSSKFEVLVKLANKLNEEISVKLLKSENKVNNVVSKTSWYLVDVC